ncbi:MAG: TetR/AcrR family transcriptional regulator [Austwickia sp.]|nr:TetR/AcrR family transcriptional regulator [Austwickia sp.]
MPEAHRPTTPPGRRERHKADKRDRITAAARARFAAAGYHATTTAQIAHDADVGAGTVFQYAATKPELLLMAMNDEIAACLATGTAAAAEQPTREPAVMTFFAPLLELADAHEENFSVYVREILFGPPGHHRQAALDLVDRSEVALRDILARPGEHGPHDQPRPDADLVNAARALVFAVLLRDQQHPPGPQPRIHHRRPVARPTAPRRPRHHRHRWGKPT